MKANKHNEKSKKHIDITIEYSPVYELAISLYTYIDKRNKKIFELGKEWYKQVTEQLSPQFKKKLKVDRIFLELGVDLLLVYSSPRKESIPEFLEWLHQLNDIEIEQIIRSILPEGVAIKDLLKKINQADKLVDNETNVCGVIRDRLYELFQHWYDEYFSKIEADILRSLKQDAIENRERVRQMKPIDLIEKVTNGMILEDIKVGEVILVPQYHSSPFNIYPFKVHSMGLKLQLFFYPIDLHAMNPGEPSAKLMRLARSIADQTRLKILRILYHDQKSFTDIVNEIGLAKSTVHHHLVMLRAAGLIRLYISEEHGTRYRVRSTGVQELSSLIQDYLKR